jgi:signal transduction histidine kinase
MTNSNGVLKLVIGDNGVGFDVDAPTVPSRRGLRNIQERVQALGGHLTIESAPGRGTEVIVEVPLNGE